MNPYQPPTTEVFDERVPIKEFQFFLTKRNLRHGQSHHLIRCRPMGVVLVSIIMIAISLVVFSYAVLYVGSALALTVMPVLLGASALAYLAVIKEPRRLTEQRMAACGMVTGAAVDVQVDEETLVAQIGSESIHWPRDKITHYRTPLGLMLVPEQFVYLFLPKRGQFEPETFRAISLLFRGK